ncbi:hypothetical protein [Mycolicibacterium sp.]|uniref:hypothetical protein n=1 Tax=Mycolicibacterium sp. TaxID=2320850 RepID=UPI0025D73955|nr:hypothetical protein [Mycolicibacterium sp.]
MLDVGGAGSADGPTEVAVAVDGDFDADSLGVTGLGDADVGVTEGALVGAELLAATDGGTDRVEVITGSELGATGSGARVRVGASTLCWTVGVATGAGASTVCCTVGTSTGDDATDDGISAAVVFSTGV